MTLAEALTEKMDENPEILDESTNSEQAEAEENSNNQETELESEASELEKEPKMPALKTVKVKLGGESYDLNLPEEVAEIAKNGIMMAADYTKNMQALRASEKTLASKLNDFDQKILEIATFLDFQKSVLDSPEAVDQKALDPEGYKRRVEYVENLTKEVEAFKSAKDSAMAEQVKAAKAEQLERTKQLIPEWLDTETCKSDCQMIVKYLTDMGVDDDSIASIYDANTIATIRKAALYDKIQSDLKTKKQTNEPKTIKSSSAKSIKNDQDLSFADILRLDM